MSMSRKVKDQVDHGASQTIKVSIERVEELEDLLHVRLFLRVFLIILDGIVNALGQILNGDWLCC